MVRVKVRAKVRVNVKIRPPRTREWIWLEPFVVATSAGDDCRWYWLLLVMLAPAAGVSSVAARSI